MNENTEELLRIIEGLVANNAQLEKENMELKEEVQRIETELMMLR